MGARGPRPELPEVKRLKGNPGNRPPHIGYRRLPSKTINRNITDAS